MVVVVHARVLVGFPGDTGEAHADCEDCTLGDQSYRHNELDKYPQSAGGRVNAVRCLLVADSNHVLLADSGNNCVREYDIEQHSLRTIAGHVNIVADILPDDSASHVGGAQVQNFFPELMTAEFDSAGRIDSIEANVNTPAALCFDPAVRGHLLIGCDNVYQRVIRRLDPANIVTMEAGDAVPVVPPTDIAAYDEHLSGLVERTLKSDVAGLDATFSDVASMCAGQLQTSTEMLVYIACQKSHVVRSFNTKTKMIHTVIGTGQSGSFKNGHVTAPSSLLIDHEGRLVIASTNCLLRYSAAQLELLAGSEDEAGFVDGPGAEARFQQITSLALDPYGNIFVCDGENNAVRCVSSSGDVQTIISGLTPTKSNQYFEFPLLAPSAVAVDESSYEAGCPRVFVSDLHRLIEIELDCKSQAEQPLQISSRAGSVALQGSKQRKNWRSTSVGTLSVAGSSRGFASKVLAPAKPKSRAAPSEPPSTTQPSTVSQRKSHSGCSLM